MRSLLTAKKLDTLVRLLAEVDHVEGAIVELGVYRGGALRALTAHRPERRAYGFDTFEGLPAASWEEGDVHRPGEFADVGAVALQGVTLIKGVFPESAADVEDVFAFAHVDFDLYRSTKDAIEWLLPRMARGGRIVLDDYDWWKCPGVRRAIEACGLPVVIANDHQAVWNA